MLPADRHWPQTAFDRILATSSGEGGVSARLTARCPQLAQVNRYPAM